MEYEAGQLAFLMDATVSASVMWHGYKTFPFTFSIHDYYIKVAKTTDYDRSLCNCENMMQGQLQHGQHQQLPWHGRQAAAQLPAAEITVEDLAGSLETQEVLLPPTMGEDGDGDRAVVA